ncbi:hypothetical protein VNO80_16248 [Phaseolus coccineus]|uniref:Uncharacterized protein n=1 Tax=Phaseolus coccineus TaxID=3886 RepID=A0AAN9MM42_PHACN
MMVRLKNRQLQSKAKVVSITLNHVLFNFSVVSLTFNLFFKTLTTLPTKEVEDTWGVSSRVAQACRGPASRATSLGSQVTDEAIDGHVEGEHVVCENGER